MCDFRPYGREAVMPRNLEASPIILLVQRIRSALVDCSTAASRTSGCWTRFGDAAPQRTADPSVIVRLKYDVVVTIGAGGVPSWKSRPSRRRLNIDRSISG